MSTGSSSPGRTMALCGLRMMPRFPSPPLKFRTVGFPQYGFKAGISGAAFPALGSSPRPVCHRPSCPSLITLHPRTVPGLCAPPLERLPPLYPRGPRSGPGFSVPVHLHLSDPMRPTRRHIPTSPLCGLYGMPSLCAGTTTPRQPTTGSELSWMVFRNMSPSGTPGNSSAACAQYFTEDAGLQLQGTVSAFPIILTLRFW